MKYVYYAIFSKAVEGGYNVSFPDIIGGVTCGDSFKEAKFMAEDVLKLMLTDAKAQCLKPRSKKEISEFKKSGDKVVQIVVNLE